MEIEIEIYVGPSGDCPFNDWMKGVKDLKIKTKILSRLDRLRLGNFGDCKSVGDGVSELRIDYGPGIRVYYSKIGVKVVLLLCGGIKRSQDRDIKTAKDYLQNYLKGKKK